MKVRELLANPAKWTQRASARNADGEYVPPDSPEACRWCLMGALEVCYPDLRERTDATDKLRHSLSQRTTEFIGVIYWNDRPGRTHAAVLALVTEADV